jgi:Zn-finger nucleic acid-binding protein
MNARNCPRCAVPLAPEAYEGFPVLRCPDCAGHLLDLSRYEAIRRLPEKSIAELEAEAKESFAGDYPAPIRCPRCHLAMEKRPLDVPGFDLHLALCRACALVWLEGGELALAQLAYQATPAFRDRQELKRRAAELEADPDRKAAFEEAVAKLPLTADPFREGVREGIEDAFFQIIAHPMRIRIR